MKNLYILFCFCGGLAFAQVGIGTETPNATLEIKSTNEATPANNDGLLIPKVEEFPVTNPGAGQDGMLVYATGAGSVSKGFYYWDNGTTAWVLATGAKKIDDLSDGVSDISGSSIFLGIDAGISDGGSNKNVGIGYQSLAGNTSGDDNVGIGFQSLYSNTSGFSNTASGNGALYSNTTGYRNTANGWMALYDNTTGDSNTAIGNGAMTNNTTGSQNTANGLVALASNTTGSNNSAFGQRALFGNTTGNYNTANGYYSLYDNTTGSNNCAFGGYSLFNNTTGTYNTAIGHSALNFNTTGNYNTANGLNALRFNTTGNSNTANGTYALYSNTTGIENTANGVYALNDNTTGNNNSAYGARALIHNTTGHHNSASGFSTLVSNTTGLYNIANGARSLYLNTTGSRNIAMGYEALYNSSGNNNVALGHQAGYFETASYRLYIESSNSTTPLIYGEFDNNIVGINGSLGVGTQAPGAPLHVEGIEASGVQDIVAALVSNSSNRPVLQFSETANVGLTEGMSLEYDGRGSGGANRMVFNSVGGNPLFEFRNGGDLTLRDGDIIVRGTATDREIKLEDDAGNPDRVLMRQTGTQDIYVGDIDNNGGDTYVRAGGSTELSVIAGTGFVGVNTLAPAWTFEVNGNAAKPGGGSWINSSDRRLKQHINQYADGLEQLLQIEPVTYHYNSLSGFDTSKQYIGVIAQDLNKIAPYMVQNYQRDGSEYMAVDNSAMTYMLINAVKTQQAEIELLKVALSEIKASLINGSNDNQN